MKIPFTVYDFFAYLSSGSLLVAAFDYTFGYQWLLAPGQISAVLAIFLIFAAYLTGHLIAHFSSFLLEDIFVAKILKRPSHTLLGEAPPRFLKFIFPGYYKALPIERQTRVQQQAASRGVSSAGEALFQHAYAVVTQSEASLRRLDEFRNLYGFARNMTLALTVSATFLIIAHFKITPSLSPWWAILAALFALGLLYRYLKFFRQFSYQLLITYAELPLISKAGDHT